MIVALLLLAQLDLCTAVKRVVRSSADAFREVRGAERRESSRKVVWTAPLMLPGADECRVIEPADLAPPFYVCDMSPAPCLVAEARFTALVNDVSACLGAPARVDQLANRRTARLHKAGVPVRATFTRGAHCAVRLFVEPLGK